MNLNRLKEIREDRDITQEKISKILNISRAHYANIEINAKIITLEKLNIFINFFDVSFDYVLNITNQRQYNCYKNNEIIDFKYLGENIKNLRIENNLTQEQLGNIINVSNACIAKYEQGKIKISTNNLCKIANFFNYSIDKLIKKHK